MVQSNDWILCGRRACETELLFIPKPHKSQRGMHVVFTLIYFRSPFIIMQVRKGLQKALCSLWPSSPLAFHQRGEKIMSFKDGVSKNKPLWRRGGIGVCALPPPTSTVLQKPASVKYATGQLHISFDCRFAVLTAPVALNSVSRWKATPSSLCPLQAAAVYFLWTASRAERQPLQHPTSLSYYCIVLDWALCIIYHTIHPQTVAALSSFLIQSPVLFFSICALSWAWSFAHRSTKVVLSHVLYIYRFPGGGRCRSFLLPVLYR